MKVDPQKLLEALGGYFVGGQAIARINKKHVTLGRLKQGAFLWTDEGRRIAETYMLPAEPAEEPSALPVKARRSRRKTEVADAVTDDPEL